MAGLTGKPNVLFLLPPGWDALSKAFPQRIIHPPIPFVNSISDLLTATLGSPSTSVRQTARKTFATMQEYFDSHCPRDADTSEGEAHAFLASGDAPAVTTSPRLTSTSSAKVRVMDWPATASSRSPS